MNRLLLGRNTRVGKPTERPEPPVQSFGIFARYPAAGHAKTRLAEQWDARSAAELYAAFIDDLLARFSTTADRRVVAFTAGPGDLQSGAAETYFTERAGTRYQIWTQPPGSLGARMAAWFGSSLSRKGDRAVLIGSDSPTLPAAYVQTAFESLAQSDVVLGPAFDGGYYLIGMRYPARNVFGEIQWSEPGVLAQSVAAVERAQATLGLLPPWYDVDTLGDLAFLRGHLAALRSAGEPMDCPRTAGMLALDTLAGPDQL